MANIINIYFFIKYIISQDLLIYLGGCTGCWIEGCLEDICLDEFRDGCDVGWIDGCRLGFNVGFSEGIVDGSRLGFDGSRLGFPRTGFPSESTQSTTKVRLSSTPQLTTCLVENSRIIFYYCIDMV